MAIVGRPNVGKATVFNRLTKSRRSIVGDEPGITRDRIYGEFEWGGRRFRLVDTGGIVPDDPELIPQEIYNQAKVALEEADVLVLVLDAEDGTTMSSPYDHGYSLVKYRYRPALSKVSVAIWVGINVPVVHEPSRATTVWGV